MAGSPVTWLQVVTAERGWIYTIRCARCGANFPVMVHDAVTVSELLEAQPESFHTCPAAPNPFKQEPPSMKSTNHKSDVKLGDRYSDPLTGFEGVATSVTFYLHGCERVALEVVKDGAIKYESFDAPRLVHVPTGTQPTSTRTGGPGGREPAPRAVSRR